MRRLTLAALLLAVTWIALPGETRAGVDIGLSLDDEGVKSFHLAIGDHYRVPEKQVIVIRKRSIPDEDLPVLFHVARKANRDPDALVELRLAGMSWIDIASHYGFSPGIFYVEFKKDPGPPYGKAWGHFKKNKESQWGRIRLSDADVVNLVNLKFVSERYGYDPDQVVKMRAKKKSFVSIHAEVKRKTGPSDKVKPVASAGKDKAKKQGKGRKK